MPLIGAVRTIFTMGCAPSSTVYKTVDVVPDGSLVARQSSRGGHKVFEGILTLLGKRSYPFELDLPTQFWIELCKQQALNGANQVPPATSIKRVDPKQILSMAYACIEGFDTCIRFADTDEDLGVLDDSFAERTQAALFLGLRG